MIEILTTQEFDHWLRRLKDRPGRVRILARLDRFRAGNPGDVKAVGQGVQELRMTYGPGYRIYFAQRGRTVVLLLCGGDKSSQSDDIHRAYRLAAAWHAQEDSHDH